MPGLPPVITGADMIVSISRIVRDAENGISWKTSVIGTLKSLTVSGFREKTPVRLLGWVGPAGFVRGLRTLAGTLVFGEIYNPGPSGMMEGQASESCVLPDELPPFCITAVFVNEHSNISALRAGREFDSLRGMYGYNFEEKFKVKDGLLTPDLYVLRIYGVEIVNWGSEYTIDVPQVDRVMQYTATSMDLVRRAGTEEEVSVTSSPPPHAHIMDDRPLNID